MRKGLMLNLAVVLTFSVAALLVTQSVISTPACTEKVKNCCKKKKTEKPHDSMMLETFSRQLISIL